MKTTVATLGPIGYLPAPGTLATGVTMLAILCMQAVTSSMLIYSAAFIVLIMGAFWSIPAAVRQLHNGADPKQIVIDEAIGTLVTFLGLSLTCSNVLIGFLLFRLFDIYKPWPICVIEKLPGTWGIILDDIVAGLCALMVLHLLFL